jgi:hypothetical protein
MFGRIAERFPQLSDRAVEGQIEIYEGICGPEPLAQLVARDDLARVFQEQP